MAYTLLNRKMYIHCMYLIGCRHSLPRHAASPQHPQVVTLAARRATVQEPGLPTRWSFGWPYGGQQNACIFSSNILNVSGSVVVLIVR